MNSILHNYLSTLELKDLQQCKNMAVFPILSPMYDDLEFLTLNEALNSGLLTVTEVDNSGSVPELKVVNNAEIPLFLLDGEELAGAKQNRIINTSILLKEKSETIIPVSCTEQGRWYYTTQEFYDSGIVMSRNIRAKKTASVGNSLRTGQRFSSDQDEIWDEIHSMSDSEDVHSPTGAMRDVYEKRMNRLDEYMQAFRLVPDQKGVMVFINGMAAGLDMINYRPAYEKLHDKLIKSYAMDAILHKKKRNGSPSFDDAAVFLEKTKSCTENRYKSVGYGWDYRYQGEDIVGSALSHEDKVIHTSFFIVSHSDKAGRISRSSRRRDFRL